HNLEDMLDKLRMGKIEITGELLDLLFDAIDGLNRLVIAVNDPHAEGFVDVPKLTTRIHRLISRQPEEVSVDLLDDLDLDEQTRKSLTEYEEHRLMQNVQVGRMVYSIQATFDFSDFDQRLRELTSGLSDSGEVISTLPAMDASGGEGISFRLLYGTTHEADTVQELAGPAAVVQALRRTSRIGPEAGPEEDVSLRSLAQTVRVDIARLDHVMNIVGELIIEKTRLEGLTRSVAAGDERALAQEIAKLSRNFDRKLNDLQKSVIEMRMVPVGQIYSKLARTVRKLARELDKEIELVLRGEETELDKVMVEELTDPLMHIIRNAMDHGIETPDERIEAGKSPVGRVLLKAYQKGNSVVIDLSDDGRGIDGERVRAAAVRKGLIGPKDPLDDRQVLELIFAPGLSTAGTVSEISGRGVGLDVVKQNLQDLKGSIEVISDPGQGSTFRIMLPITLAILQALIIEVAGERFAIPLTSVEEALRIQSSEIRTIEGREVYKLRETTLPLLRLSDAFKLDDAVSDAPGEKKWFVVVTRSGERLVGILVDALVRQQEIVIKSIGERLKKTPGIAGATEIGDSETILVIDAGSLIERFGGVARSVRRQQTVAAEEP
ncbi:MAG TPA: chemotaxis protein CheA, partial [Thermoanaerobaculia bacterium]|nr:chemotaxis protein CheA [Thermoanaerobaculia bacterium]